MGRHSFEYEEDQVEQTATKTVAAVLAWVGTAAAEAIAAGAGAATWVHGVLLAVGGAANAAAVFYSRNKPKS
jgi:hypothetical protein